MPRTEESNQRIREEQKRKIILAATKIFAHKGLVATKMADIASEAGISYGLLYHYFTNKELIFRAAIEWATLGSERMMKRILELPLSPWERLHKITVEILEGIKEQPESFLIVQQAITSDVIPREIREMAIHNSLAGLEVFTQLIIEGQTAGEVVAGDPAELAALYLSCIGGVGLDFIYFLFPPTAYPRPETVLRLLKA